MKLVIALTILFIGVTAYDYTRPATCKQSVDISIMGRTGLYEKCQTPWGVYYKERLIAYIY